MRGQIKGPNDVILGRFVIDAVFEGMAIVYHVHDQHDLNKQYIAKRIHPEHSQRQDVLDWFAREIRVWQHVTGHPHIVQLIDPFRQDVDGTSYFFTEYVKGKNLSEIIKATPTGRLSYPQALRWVVQIASAMEFASVQKKNGHGVFVHRDLDSSNIMITEKGVAKVTDWGIGKNLLEPEDQIPFLTIKDFTEGPAIGKAWYMPPEQFPPGRGEQYGVQGDVYYLGGLIFEMLTGQTINPKDSAQYMQRYARTEDEVCRCLEEHHQHHVLKTLRSTSPRQELVELVAQCIQVDAGQRVGNFSKILKQLNHLCQEVKDGQLKANFMVCNNCSFIALEEQTTCPVCNRKHQFQPWQSASFDFALATGEPISLEIETPQTVTIPPPSPGTVNELVRISAGETVLGANTETLSRLIQSYGISGERLEQLATPEAYRMHLPEFLITRQAVSNEEYREFVEATKWRKPAHWQVRDAGGKKLYSGDYPVVNVDFMDVEAFCQWKEVRLPTNEEWERAARGPDGRSYPWGNEWKTLPNGFTCNTLERHDSTGEELVPANAFAAYASPEGVLNMAGNVWEWVDGGEHGLKHTRGGSWRFQGDVYSLLWFRMPTDAEIMQDDIGFRYVRTDSRENSAALPSSIADLDALVSVPGGLYPVGVTPQHLVNIARKFALSQGDAQRLGRNQGRTIRTNAFQIRKYLVTNEEYYQFVQETGYPPPKHWLLQLVSWSDRPFLRKYRYHPVTNVSYKDAAAFCSWKGGRLPGNDEWECAARGEASTIYPWGDNFDPLRCNVSESGLARTNRVNEYESGASPLGCFDMVGNVKEWVAPDSAGRYFVRGGSFADKGALYGLAFLCIQADPEVTAPYLGFRYVL